MEYLPTIITLSVMLVGGFAFLVFILKIREKSPNVYIEDSPSEEGAYLTEVNATVVDMVCFVKTVGTKSPKTIQDFKVCFESDTGEVFNLNVSEEMYAEFEKGQKGILTLADGNFYGFALHDDTFV